MHCGRKNSRIWLGRAPLVIAIYPTPEQALSLDSVLRPGAVAKISIPLALARRREHHAFGKLPFEV